MSGWSHLNAAIAVLTHPEAAAKGMDSATRKSANAVRREIRRVMPRAKKATHLPPDRKPGMMRAAVSVKLLGRGFDAQAKVHAGGIAHILIPGAKAHEIVPVHAKALHLSDQKDEDLRRSAVQHPAIDGRPYVELGSAAAQGAIDAIMAETGQEIVRVMAAEIEAGA